jgi:hypothetical protein
VSQIVFLTVLGQFLFLVFDKDSVGSLELVNLKIESMDHTLQFGDISLSLVDLDGSFFGLFGSLI